MQIDEISKGGAVEIDVKFNGKTVKFKSEVVEQVSNSLLIQPIKFEDQTIGFSENCQMNLLYVSDNKPYLWVIVSIKLVKYAGEVYHMIEVEGGGKPFNRRESYRIYIGEDMPLFVNSPNGPIAISVLVKDVSETGIGFISNTEIDVDRTVRIKLKDDNSQINLSGTVVRKEFLEHLNSYLYGCQLKEKNLQLSKFIARRQHEQLRKKSVPAPPSKDDKARKTGEITPNKKG